MGWAYQSTAMASRLTNTNTFLLVYLEGLIHDLKSKNPTDLLPETVKVVDMVQGASAQARVLGNSLAQLTMAQHHFWWSQSGLPDSDHQIQIELQSWRPG